MRSNAEILGQKRGVQEKGVRTKIALLTVCGSLLIGSSLAQADIIKCSFTEPFINTVYSMSQQSLTMTSPDSEKTVIKNVSFQIKGAGEFELLTKDGKLLQKLTLNHMGSDGMSDEVFPYSVTEYSVPGTENKLTGGCSSNFLKVKPTAE